MSNVTVPGFISDGTIVSHAIFEKEMSTELSSLSLNIPTTANARRNPKLK